MWRGVRNLPFLASGGDFSEHVLVEIALRIAVLHRHVVDEVDNFGEQSRGWNREPCVLHVVGVGGFVGAEGLQEGENMLADDGVHLARLKILENRPAKVFVGTLLGVFAWGENLPFDGLL